MEAVQTRKIPRGSLGIWALGQSGFLFKDNSGLLVAIDPCLADPVGKVAPGWHRLYPPPIQPEHLQCDVLIVTHDHLDHLDPDTIAGLSTDAVGKFVGPGNACRHLIKLGIPESRIVRLDASQSVTIGSLQLTGTLAITNDPTQPDAEGVVLRFQGALSLYHTGDTGFSPLLTAVKPLAPDIYMPCINGRYGNLDAREAAVLGASLRSRWAIPHHYDMFRDNLADPKEFAARMKEMAPETECRVLSPGETAIFQPG
jgi:L-ascorbate 6-phosphate lactonase